MDWVAPSMTDCSVQRKKNKALCHILHLSIHKPMSNLLNVEYQPEKNFERFLEQLRTREPQAWQWLCDQFRAKVKPWLFKIDGNLPPGTILSVDEFIEEVFANSLFKFYEAFENGQFKSLADLRGLMFRIAELKLKEGYHKVRRDKLIYFTDDLNSGGLSAHQDDLSVRETQDQDLILELRDQVNKLSSSDRELLVRFARGEELASIAANLGLDPAACRKRKQRALQKLKQLVLAAQKSI